MRNITTQQYAVFTIMFLLLTISLQAQNPIAREVMNRKLSQSFETAHDLFTVAPQYKNTAARNDIQQATVLELKSAALQELVRKNPSNVALSIPTHERTFNLQLYEVDIYSEGFSVLTSSGQHFTNSGGKHYRGIIDGDNASLVAISIYNDDIMGVIIDESGNHNLGKIGSVGTDYILYNDKNLPNPEASQCFTTDEHVKEPLSDERSFHNGKVAATKCVRAYWEADYNLYTNKGSSTTNVVNYLTGLFNQSKIIYDNDEISITLQQIFVWTSASPYSGNASNRLSQFKAYRTSFDGDFAHLLHLGGNGGVAYVNAVCSRGWNYGVSGISASYNNYPTYSWSVMVVTHEQGHLMGSPHTHDCSWNGNNTAIDNCASTSCTSLEGPSPAGGGTIMSYCHLTSAGINLSKGFGPQPKQRIQNALNSKSCLQATCNGTPPPPVTITHNAVYTLSVGHSGQLADVSGRSTVNGGNVIQWPSHGGTNQQWRALSLGEGFWRFVNINSGRSLSILDASNVNGANIVQWDWQGTNHQQWSLQDATNGFFYVVNRGSGQAMEVVSSGTANGANIQQGLLASGTNQRWRFNLITPAPSTAALQEESESFKLILAPNPTVTEVNIILHAKEKKEAAILIRDMRGVTVHSEKASLIEGKNILTTWAPNALPSGLFIVEVDGKRAKLLIEK